MRLIVITVGQFQSYLNVICRANHHALAENPHAKQVVAHILTIDAASCLSKRTIGAYESEET